jgi:hypothetical protein
MNIISQNPVSSGTQAFNIIFPDRDILSGRKTVLKETYEAFRDIYPDAHANKAYWEVLRLLAFSSFRDVNEGGNEGVILTWTLLRNLAGEDDFSFRSGVWLVEMGDVIGLEMEIGDWDYRKRKARVVVPTWHSDIEEVLEKENNIIIPWNQKVYWKDGTRVTKRGRAQFRKQITGYSKNLLIQAHPVSKCIADYLNSLDPLIFTRQIDKRIEAAMDELSSWSRGTRQERINYSRQLQILQSINEFAMPIYGPSDRTVRLYGLMDDLTRVKRELRSILLEGWIEFDLVSSQLAIVARLWKIKEVEDFLKGGGSIWMEMLAAIGINGAALKVGDRARYDSIKKEVLKPFLYSICYGMLVKNLKANFISNMKGIGETNIEAAWTQLKSNHIIKALLRARTQKLRKVKREKGLLLAIPGCDGALPLIANTWAETRSALAQEAQAYEMGLLLPVIYLAQRTDQFSVVLWQHDGFTLAIKDRRPHMVRKVIEAIEAAIEGWCQRWGVISGLEVA